MDINEYNVFYDSSRNLYLFVGHEEFDTTALSINWINELSDDNGYCLFHEDVTDIVDLIIGLLNNSDNLPSGNAYIYEFDVIAKSIISIGLENIWLIPILHNGADMSVDHTDIDFTVGIECMSEIYDL